MNTYQNIPTNSFQSTEVKTETRHAILTQKVSDILLLTLFAINTFIKGATKFQAKSLIKVEYLTIFAKMVVAKDEAEKENSTSLVDVNYDEVTILSEYLELEINYQEHLKDINSDDFCGTEDYMGMKILLLEIKTWLMGEIISIGDKIQERNEVKKTYFESEAN